ncbi:hypothetical protein FGO68_gene4428 [Halteria grandinella]|uniref:TLDc domain-containing protein n=1 Tax=Halteria grandinella TaxID=5974 RepID=A0A8J8NS65_HALGN|nr:hypothetical protein FGO68_gene4428 [Halteria grandinella]
MPNLVNCSIHPKEKAMYICMTPTCPKYEALRLYCSMCNEKIAHDHVSQLIITEVNKSDNDWKELRGNLSQMRDKVDSLTLKHKELIIILDKNLSLEGSKGDLLLLEEIETFRKLFEDIERFYNDNIYESISKCNILKLISCQPQIAQYNQRYNHLLCLNQSQQLVLWTFFAQLMPDFQLFPLIEKLDFESISMLTQIKLQQVQLSIQQLTPIQTKSTLNILDEKQEFNLEKTFFALTMELNQISNTEYGELTCSVQLYAQKVSQIRQIRGQLDAIGVCIIFINQRHKNFELKSEIDLLTQIFTTELQKQAYEIQTLKQKVEEQSEIIINHEFLINQLMEAQKSKFEVSRILTSPLHNLAMTNYFMFVGKPNFKAKLLYRASKDGFGAKDFHRQCDNKRPTLTIIKADKGHIIGGYTEEHWSSDGIDKEDTDSWVFTITHPHPFRYNGVKRAIGCIKNQGAIFGIGNDIAISDNSNANTDSYVHGTGDASFIYGSTHLLNRSGKTYFRAAEIETYLIEYE